MMAAEYLNEFAVEGRYPGDYSSISNDETKKALEYNTDIKTYILDLAKKNNFPA